MKRVITCKDCIHYFVCEYKPKTNLVSQCADHIDRSNFVELPCKVGDTIFCIIHILGETEIVSSKVQRILFTEDDCRLIVQDNNYIGLSVNDVGKTIFLSREEAEAALNERIGRETEVGK